MGFHMGFLHGYRSRAEVLRAETNRDLLRVRAGHEEQEAARFTRFNSDEEKRDESRALAQTSSSLEIAPQ